jgi:hypothetical protein
MPENGVINGEVWHLMIAVLLKKGIVVGIEQNITLQTTLGLLQFRLITKVTHDIACNFYEDDLLTVWYLTPLKKF